MFSTFYPRLSQTAINTESKILTFDNDVNSKMEIINCLYLDDKKMKAKQKPNRTKKDVKQKTFFERKKEELRCKIIDKKNRQMTPESTLCFEPNINPNYFKTDEKREKVRKRIDFKEGSGISLPLTKDQTEEHLRNTARSKEVSKLEIERKLVELEKTQILTRSSIFKLRADSLMPINPLLKMINDQSLLNHKDVFKINKKQFGVYSYNTKTLRMDFLASEKKGDAYITSVVSKINEKNAGQFRDLVVGKKKPDNKEEKNDRKMLKKHKKVKSLIEINFKKYNAILRKVNI